MSTSSAALGDLPEWDLGDLYPGMEFGRRSRPTLPGRWRIARPSPPAYRGKLADIAAAPGGGRTPARGGRGATRRWTTCWASSAPMPACSIRATPPIRSAPNSMATSQEKLTAASTHLLFFTLEINRIDDAVLDRLLADPGLGHYRPWIDDVRKDKPYQLEDRIEQLFHEKSVTGRGAWNRLFDETIAALRFEVDGERADARADAEPPAGRRKRPPRQAAADALAETFKEQSAHLHADHQHAGQGQGDLRPLARLRGRRGFAPPRQPRRARGRRCAGRRRARRLSAAVAPLLPAEGAAGSARTG